MGLHSGLMLALLWSAAALASPIETLNAARIGDCRPDSSRPLFKPVAALNAAARRLSRGVGLHAALIASDYRADETTAMRFSGLRNEAELRRDLRSRFCGTLRNPRFTEAGAFSSGNELWLVIAAPFSPPSHGQRGVEAEKVLALVNAARAHARRCGRESTGPASPLRANPELNRAAQLHADNMARFGELEHRGRDGSNPAQRAARAGYEHAALVGENIAGGAQTADEVVRGWLASPGHCANLMNRNFVDMGIAFAVNPHSALGIYWAQELAKPLQR
jgi:uncharacterized protein YkwD